MNQARIHCNNKRQRCSSEPVHAHAHDVYGEGRAEGHAKGHAQCHKEGDEHTRLAANLFCVITQCAPRQAAELLAILLGDSSFATLRRVDAAARANGASVPTTSRFQDPLQPMIVLDLAMSFLDWRDLQAAETACRSWRAACVSHGAGWRDLVSREVVDDLWNAEIVRHRLRPQSLGKITNVDVCQTNPAICRTIAQLPNLTMLDVHHFDEHRTPIVELARLVRLPRITALRTSLNNHPNVVCDMLNVAASAPGLRKLFLELTPTQVHLECIGQLMNLSTLSILSLSPLRWTAEHTRPLLSLGRLTNLTVGISCAVPLDLACGLRLSSHAIEHLGSLTSLTSLALSGVILDQVDDDDACSLALQPIGRLTALCKLRIPTVQNHRLKFVPTANLCVHAARCSAMRELFDGASSLQSLESIAAMSDLTHLGLNLFPHETRDQMKLVPILSRLGQLRELRFDCGRFIPDWWLDHDDHKTEAEETKEIRETSRAFRVSATLVTRLVQCVPTLDLLLCCDGNVQTRLSREDMLRLCRDASSSLDASACSSSSLA